MHIFFAQAEVWNDHRAYGRWVTISKMTAEPACQSTGLRYVIQTDAVPGRPYLSYLGRKGL